MMKTSDGVKAAYNAQAVVDRAFGIIVAADVTQDESDNQQLQPLLQQTRQNTQQTPARMLADSGYVSDESLLALERAGVDGYVKPQSLEDAYRQQCRYEPEGNRFEGNRFVGPDGQALTYRRDKRIRGTLYAVYRAKGRGGKELNVRLDEGRLERMRAKLATPEGIATYHLRQEIVEPVFGHTKETYGLRRLLLRGLSGARIEHLLSSLAHNLDKLVRYGPGNGAAGAKTQAGAPRPATPAPATASAAARTSGPRLGSHTRIAVWRPPVPRKLGPAQRPPFGRHTTPAGAF